MRVAAAVFVLALVSAPLRGQIPSALTDVEFRALRASVSESGGLFGGHQLVSNENAVSRTTATLARHGTPGGVYIGVGPEQNFTYIATSRPQFAFLLDIRREQVMQHLMYKAMFELAADRADFVSLLFARPRPAGLDSASSIDRIWDAYGSVRADTARARAHLRRIDDQLARVHGIVLDESDAALLRFVYAALVVYGPTIRDNLGAADSLASRLADGWSDRDLSLIIQVRDSVSGAPVPWVYVGFAEISGAFGTLYMADSAGRLRLPPYAVGSRLRVRVQGGLVYDSTEVEERIDKERPVLTIKVRRGPRCQLDAVAQRCGRNGPPPVAEPLPGGPMTPFESGRTFIAMTASVDSAGQHRSFLATEDNYRFVRSMHQRNLIVPVAADFAGPRAIRAIGEWARERGATVSTFYMSNVTDYLYRNDSGITTVGAFWDGVSYAGTARAFWDNAATLPFSNGSLFIDHGALCPVVGTIAAGRAARSYMEYSRSWLTLRTSGCKR
jgi:hypothetical protein